MNPLIPIPREKLAELLQASGSVLTPEQYAALVRQGDEAAFGKYGSRCWVAASSKYFLLLVTILALLVLLGFGFDLENFIILVGLATVTFFEYRVHRYFRENNPAAPTLGFRNQSGFAAGIIIYCLYHAFAPYHLPADAMTMVEESSLLSPEALKSMVRGFYFGIAVLAGGSQFGLAWYYLRARPDEAA